MSETIAFVGLGAMGAAMAANVLKAGFGLRVYNRTPEKAQILVAQGATLTNSPANAVTAGGIVVTMLTDDEALEQVTVGPNGFLNALGANGIHVSMSTVSPDVTKRLTEAHQKSGSHYVAAPVFGKPDAAAAQKLWIAVAGNAEAKARVQPVLDSMGQGTYDFGDDPAAANVVKLIGNFLFGAATEAMAEGFTLADKNGVPRQAVFELFSNTLFNCPVYKNYGKMVASRNYQPVGAPPSLIRKDYGLLLEVARQSQTPMPLGSLLHDRLTARVAKGHDAEDWASLAEEAAEAAGI